MKKIVSVLLISAMLVTALTACDNGSSSNSNDNSTSNTSTDNSTSENSADNSNPESTPDSSTPDDSNSESDSLFNLGSCEEFCFSTNIISAQLNKIIVIKPKDGKESEISTAIDTYYNSVKNDPNIAFYPAQQASADGAVKGKSDDGYYYVIVHENGADIETAMLAAGGSARMAREAAPDDDFGGFGDPAGLDDGFDDNFGMDGGTFEDEGVDNSGLPFPENKAGEMVKAALAADVWPAMDIVETQQFVDIMFYIAE